MCSSCRGDYEDPMTDDVEDDGEEVEGVFREKLRAMLRERPDVDEALSVELAKSMKVR
jgi:hypothetical protein